MNSTRIILDYDNLFIIFNRHLFITQKLFPEYKTNYSIISWILIYSNDSNDSDS